MNCDDTNPAGNVIVYADADADGWGEIAPSASWHFCITVQAMDGGLGGPRIINWDISGDNIGSPDHDINGQTTIYPCTPVMLSPDTSTIQGCNGATQTLTFELWNYSAGNDTINLAYDVPTGNGSFSGPTSFVMSDGNVITFTTQFVPDQCAAAGAIVTGTLEATGSNPGEYDLSTVRHTVTALAGFQRRSDSPQNTMDNVVVWASQADGGLWSIGGYSGNGEGYTQRYDPGTDTWTTHTPESTITPTIEYPIDGCYGLNGAGDEIVVLFPDTIVTGSLHIYNITTDSWYNETIPAFYPDEGRWGHDVVSLLNIPGVNENVCYLSGGATQTGGGRTRDLWVYYPETNSGAYVGHFPADFYFDFHASWYVPWVSEQGGICVAGGVDHNNQMSTTTQCYNLQTNTFEPPNATLGPLPEFWWGMADGWQLYHGQYQIWMANGVAQDGTLLPASLYASEESGGFTYGPGVPQALYRVEGDSYNGQFYMLNGSRGGFWYSPFNQYLGACTWCNNNYLPLVLRGY